MPQEIQPVDGRPGEPKPVVVLLVDAHALMRRCMAKLLVSEASDFRVRAVSSVGDARIPADEGISLVIINITSMRVTEPAVVTELRCARERFPNAPLIILSKHNDADTARRSMQLGARGLIPASSSLPVMIAAIRLVLAGGTYAQPDSAPAGALANIDHGTEPPTPPASPPTTRLNDLTKREAEVLALLKEGKANKVIAYELNMSENTVKVHVRRIMRKLNVSNRTEAAFSSPPAFPPRKEGLYGALACLHHLLFSLWNAQPWLVPGLLD